MHKIKLTLTGMSSCHLLTIISNQHQVINFVVKLLIFNPFSCLNFIIDNDVNNPLWYDWSVGVKDETPGSGLLDINAQPVWYEAGTSSTAVFSVANSKLTGMIYFD